MSSGDDSSARGPASSAGKPEQLELGEIEPLSGTLWEPPPAPKESRAMKWIAVVILLALGGGAFVIFTDAGRDLLPTAMQPEAKSVARKIERRADAIGREEFYTFTDDHGVVHIVDDLEKVPRKYRARAKKKR